MCEDDAVWLIQYQIVVNPSWFTLRTTTLQGALTAVKQMQWGEVVRGAQNLTRFRIVNLRDDTIIWGDILSIVHDE